ncbi:MAG: hypothetical protein AABY22_13760 [Nanoarchaeota archaeon]
MKKKEKIDDNNKNIYAFTKRGIYKNGVKLTKMTKPKPSSKGWEKRFNDKFKVYQSAYEQYGRIYQYFGEGIKKNLIDFPVNSVKSFIREEIKRVKRETAKKISDYAEKEYDHMWRDDELAKFLLAGVIKKCGELSQKKELEEKG